MKKHKKYALLEDGTIEPLYYSNGEQRNIEDNCLIVDRFSRVCIMTLCLEIIQEADTTYELEEYNELKNRQETIEKSIETYKSLTRRNELCIEKLKKEYQTNLDRIKDWNNRNGTKEELEEFKEKNNE